MKVECKRRKIIIDNKNNKDNNKDNKNSIITKEILEKNTKST